MMEALRWSFWVLRVSWLVFGCAFSYAFLVHRRLHLQMQLRAYVSHPLRLRGLGLIWSSLRLIIRLPASVYQRPLLFEVIKLDADKGTAK